MLRKLTLAACAGSVAFAGWLAWAWSPTSDEAIHVASGYQYLTKGAWRFDPEHPPLVKLLTALPVLALQPNLPANDTALWQAAAPTRYDSWRESRTWADSWLYESGNDAQVLAFTFRIPAIVLWAALLVSLWILVRRWYNEQVAAWATMLTAWNPALLAHAPLANTDVPLALALLWFVAALVEFKGNPTVRSLCWLALAGTLALLTKHSALLIVGMGYGLAYWWSNRRLQTAGILLGTTWLGIWIGYGFTSPLSLAGPSSLSGMVDLAAQELLPVVRWMFPTDWLKGVSMAISFASVPRPTFILGQVLPGGVWWYFPLLLLLKQPLFLLAAAARNLLKPTSWRTWQPATLIAVLLGGVFLLAALRSPLAIGIRHITPLIVLLCVAAGATLSAMRLRVAGTWALLCILPVALHGTAVLGYGNLATFVVPPAQLYGDSNLDWGQQNRELASWLREQGGRVCADEWVGSLRAEGVTVVTEASRDCRWLVRTAAQDVKLGTPLLPVAYRVQRGASTVYQLDAP